MAKKRLGLLHTSATLVPIFEQLTKAKLPGVAVFNLVDDSLIKDVIAPRHLRPQTAPRGAPPAGHFSAPPPRWPAGQFRAYWDSPNRRCCSDCETG